MGGDVRLFAISIATAASGLDRDPLQQRQLREIVEPRYEVVLAGPDRIEAERAHEPRLLQRLGEAPAGSSRSRCCEFR